MDGQASRRLMKWLAAARLGMRWPQVMSTLTGRRETRRLIWPISCLVLLFTSVRLANGRPTPKVLKMWRFVMLLVLGSRSRFTKLCGLLIAGDVLDANDMLATIQRLRHSEGRLAYHCLEQLVERPPSLPRVHLSHKVRRSGPITWCTMCGAYSSNRSIALRQCCTGSCPSDTRSQRLRLLVIGRHPIT